jgi:hypothetical protein
VSRASRKRDGAVIAQRLRERRAEIEQAILTRTYSVSQPPATGGREYTEGLRAAVAAGVELGLTGIEQGEGRATPIPDALLAQARLAARSGVSLDTVLRRYFAGHTLIEDFIVEEAERTKPLDPAELKRLLRSQAAIVDGLLAAVSNVYNEEAERRAPSSERRRTERIERLLGGEPLDTTDLGYELGGWHVALLASGPDHSKALAGLARSLDARPLAVRREEGILWAWLGARRWLDPGEVESLARRELPAGFMLAIGEAGEGIAGWRLSHRQARAALSVALRGEERVVRYAGVALLASILEDELLSASLRSLYLEPLEAERDGGEIFYETLRAYFSAGWSVSSAASMLGVRRHTVATRLRTIEERLGRPLNTCAAELEGAISLRSLERREQNGRL